MIDFKTKTIKEIKWWGWAAAVAPISSLAGLFFIKTFGTDTWFAIALIIGETIFFTVAVIWWWWAMYVMRNLVSHWGETGEKIKEVSAGIKEVKSIVSEIQPNDK